MFKLRGKALVDFLNKFQHFVVMAIEIGKSNNKMKKKNAIHFKKYGRGSFGRCVGVRVGVVKKFR